MDPAALIVLILVGWSLLSVVVALVLGVAAKGRDRMLLARAAPVAANAGEQRRSVAS